MTEKTQGICVGFCISMVLILLLNIVPLGINFLPPLQLGKYQNRATHTSGFPSNILGFTAQSISFGKNSFLNFVLVRDADGKAIARLDQADFISWSPSDNIMLVESTGDRRGFKLIDFELVGAHNMLNNPTIYAPEAKEVTFSPSGESLEISGINGEVRQVSVKALLQRDRDFERIAMLTEPE